jgi:hypothetical protein
MRQLITCFGPFRYLETGAVTWTEFERILPAEQLLSGGLYGYRQGLSLLGALLSPFSIIEIASMPI